MKSEPPGEHPPDDLDIDIEDAPPPPAGAPLNFRERLVLHLKTTSPAALEQAEREFRGVFASVHEYVCEQIASHIPDWTPWIIANIPPEELREDYEAGRRVLWVIPLPNGRVLVFETER